MQHPSNWPTPHEDVVAGARERILTVLADTTRSAQDLSRFYDPQGNYAGPIFDDRTGSDANDITAHDLLAITSMQVQAGPGLSGGFSTQGSRGRSSSRR